ncbi:MAG TPA: DUF4162 domain-containing protein, partial [Ktedonobacteraceae bacterium]
QDSILSINIDNPDEQNPALIQALVTAGAQIRYVEPITHSLEEIYLELVESDRSPANDMEGSAQKTNRQEAQNG